MESNIKASITLQTQTYELIALKGTEAIAKPFVFDVSILVDNDFFKQPIIGQTATIAIQAPTSSRQITGTINSMQPIMLDDNNQQQLLLTIQPKLINLKHHKIPNIILNATTPEAIFDLLNQSGYATDQIELKTVMDFTTKAYRAMVQRQNAFEYFSQLSANAGLFYWFDSNNNHEMIYLGDDNAFFRYRDAIVLYTPASGMDDQSTQALRLGLQQLSLQTLPQAPAQTVIGHHYLNAETQPQGQAKTGTDYTHTHFGRGVMDFDNGARQAQFAAEQAQLETFLLEAVGNLPDLMPGMIIDLDAYAFDAAISGNYLITAIEHELIQRVENLAEPQAYRQHLRLSPSDRPFRMAYHEFTLLPVADYAVIESQTTQPNLDQNGQYRLRHRFDLADTQHAQATPPIPSLQPFGGEAGEKSVGAHFPLRDSVEVLVGHMNSDPDRPLILGSVPNPDQHSPVTSKNPLQNLLRTGHGHELLMDDTANKEKLRWSTPAALNLIELDATQGTHAVRMQSKQGAIAMRAAQSISSNVGENKIEQTLANRTELANQNHMTIAGDEIHHQSALNTFETAARHVQFESGKNTNITSGNNLAVEVQHNANIHVQGQQGVINLDNGNFFLNSHDAITITGAGDGDIELAQAGGGIRLTKDGHVIFYGNAINVKASQNLTLKGKVNFIDGAAPAPQPLNVPNVIKNTPIPDLVKKPQEPIKTVPAHWIKIRYEDQHGKPVANCQYTIIDSKKKKFIGHLNDQGEVYIKPIAPGTATIYMGDYTSEAQHKKALYSLYDNLQNILDQMLDEVAEKAAIQNAELKKHNKIARDFIYTGKFIEGLYDSAKSTIEGLVTLAGKVGMERVELMKDVVTGNIDDINNKLNAAKEKFNLAEEDIKKVYVLLKDKTVRDMLTQFTKKYFQTESDPAKAHMASAISFNLILLLGTGGAGDAAEAAAIAGDTAEATKTAEEAASISAESIKASNYTADAVGTLGKISDEIEELQKIQKISMDVDETVTIKEVPLELIEKRKKLAYHYYILNDIDEFEAIREIEGIDFSKPVELNKPEVGEKFQQYQVPNGPKGRYYSKIGEIPTKIGINPQGINLNNYVIDKITNYYETNKTMLLLKLFAKPGMIDDWSVPGEDYVTEGGGIQYFASDKSGLTKISK